MVLNLQNRPEVVVLTVDKYNQLLKNGSDHAVLESAIESLQQQESQNRRILVTGGAGYIGAHATRELLKAGYQVTILDNLSSGKRENVPAGVRFIEGSVGDANLLRDIFAQERFYAVMHFAASIEVEESVREPEKYLKNNTLNTAVLLSAMAEYDVKKIIFSSTAAVYGEQQVVPIPETAKLSPNNPYGYSKLLAERLIKYHCHFSGFQAVVFRYFNACGCDFDGEIMPTHQSHLIPIVLEVVLGKRPYLLINGTDYNTQDGTCVRDYVHVLDIARAHVVALAKLEATESYRIYNIGTGHGSSVREVVNKASEILERMIPMEAGPRRAGDAPATVADNRKLREELGFELQHSDLDTIIATSWTQMQRSMEKNSV